MMVVCFAVGQAVAAQSVTFHIQGNNPYCKADYPNGANYHGVASVAGFTAQILKVDFQVQYQTAGG
jgi:hypothetical protein